MGLPGGACFRNVKPETEKYSRLPQGRPDRRRRPGGIVRRAFAITLLIMNMRDNVFDIAPKNAAENIKSVRAHMGVGTHPGLLTCTAIILGDELVLKRKIIITVDKLVHIDSIVGLAE